MDNEKDNKMSDYDNDPARVKCVIIRETEKALLIRQDQKEINATQEVWVPRSQCSHISKLGRNKTGFFDATIEMSEWLAEEKELDYQ